MQGKLLMDIVCHGLALWWKWYFVRGSLEASQFRRMSNKFCFQTFLWLWWWVSFGKFHLFGSILKHFPQKFGSIAIYHGVYDLFARLAAHHISNVWSNAAAAVERTAFSANCISTQWHRIWLRALARRVTFIRPLRRANLRHKSGNRAHL